MKHSKVSQISSYLLLACALLFPLFATQAEQPRQEARVVKVLDGDTLIVAIGSRHEHVRLIGIDTPESRPNRRAEKQAQERHLNQGTVLQMGHRAAEYSRSLLPKKSVVYLEYDVGKRDHYQRLLAYAWLPNGRMANEEIVKAGYAYLLSIPPNIKYRDRFATAFSEARSAQRGLWSNTAVQRGK